MPFNRIRLTKRLPKGLRIDRYHLICCAIYTVLCLSWNYWANQDQSYDQLAYHAYTAMAWWQDRLPTELFAASVQSYLNPLPHLPFYAFLTTGWNNLAVASLLAILHSTNLWLTHAISVTALRPIGRLRQLLTFLGVLLGALTPAFLIETGGSFSDVIVSIPSLAALLFAMLWVKSLSADSKSGQTDWRLLWASAALSGFATGLKPTAVVFAVALAISTMTVSQVPTYRVLWRMLLAGAAGLALSGGSHALELWRSFSNPVFPLFNGIFQSPWYPPVNMVSDRFRPTSLVEALRYPLALADAYSRPGIEVLAVDYRPVLLIALFFMLFVARLVSRTNRHSTSNTAMEPAQRIFWLSGAVFLPIWLYTSANTRYALQFFLLLGPATALVAYNFKGRTSIWVLLAIALPLAAQAGATLMANDPREESAPWGYPWFDWRIPQRLSVRPAYYLSMQTQAYSALALALPKGSRQTNLLGQAPLSPLGPVWRQVRQYRQQSTLPWRSLLEITVFVDASGVSTKYLNAQDALLSDYGLKADRTDCEFIELGENWTPPLHWVNYESKGFLKPEYRRKVILSCRLVETDSLSLEERTRRAIIDARFERWERHCPKVFSPPLVTSIQASWKSRNRIYQNTETMLENVDGELYARSLWTGTSEKLEGKNGVPFTENCPTRGRFPNRMSATKN